MDTENEISSKEEIIEEQRGSQMSNKLSTIVMALIVAIPTASIVAYIIVPDNVDELLASVGDTLSMESVESSQSQPPMNSYPESSNWGQAQQPEWVTGQRAEMEKRRLAFDKQRADAMAENRGLVEQPQWVKDQQAKMKQEQEKYQEWSKQAAERAYNRSQEFARNQPMNGYAQNPYQYNNSYPYPVNPYYYNNTPRYGYAPYNTPNGWYGYPNR